MHHTLQGPADLPLDGGWLLVAPPFVARWTKLGGAPGAPGAGWVILEGNLPHDPMLLGLRVDFQSALFDPGASWGFSLTQGLEMWIL